MKNECRRHPISTLGLNSWWNWTIKHTTAGEMHYTKQCALQSWWWMCLCMYVRSVCEIKWERCVPYTWSEPILFLRVSCLLMLSLRHWYTLLFCSAEKASKLNRHSVLYIQKEREWERKVNREKHIPFILLKSSRYVLYCQGLLCVSFYCSGFERQPLSHTLHWMRGEGAKARDRKRGWGRESKEKKYTRCHSYHCVCV